ncbi:MAG TPA: HD domain-containing protein [Phycisphaerae bacterium]|jgi:HD-GYP domain-containing protein (c-di-GMP phosphodiesterase class II)|nr:HD domain-containing protein [Phycisphaerae bacterium]HOB76697.1 HD domain-containing protein [Phycisphaerae bacterium]HOJ56392.1 HD domain-containing protein [Phycisphaerae bacterium]HOL26298.1 HD domain-containing protein [Phycisphaerae bacterium]HPP20746.1 HD domain-containing protein [Phycisphaerae bacterium]
MIRLTVSALEPGMVLAAPIPHPQAPDRILLNAGVCLDAHTLRGLQRFPIHAVWIQHPGFDFLDDRLSNAIPQSRVRIYESVKQSFSSMAGQTTPAFNLADYRTVIGNLICSLVAERNHAVFAERIFCDEGELFGHCANVAYLSLLIGMRLRSYIGSQRKYVVGARAEDLTNLGLGAMFHDIGKVGLDKSHQSCHVIDKQASDPEYQTHPERGYRTLNERLEATATAAILHHHQRFDGQGFPVPKKQFREREVRPLAGSRIHIFARVVAAANVLDALISACQKRKEPMVAALAAIQQEPYLGMLDPVILRAVLQCIPPFPLSTCVTLSDGRDAVVVDLNESDPCRPRVRVLRMGGDPSAPAGEEIDLASPGAPSIISEGGQSVAAFVNWQLPSGDSEALAAGDADCQMPLEPSSA